MYQVNDSVMYGTHGVCEVTAVGRLSMSVADRKKKYYTLRPVYQKDSLVYVPVDNVKLPMRLVLTGKEAEAEEAFAEQTELVEEIPQLETIWIGNEKERESQYKEAVRSGDCRELVRIIKTIYLHKKERVDEGKKVAAVDERYFHQAEELLYEELAYALDMEVDQIGDYIASKIRK